MELGVPIETVAARVVACARHQRLAALDAHHRRATARDRQAEIAQPTEQVGDALARSRIEQLHGAPDQQAVDVDVHLGEVGRPEIQPHTELRQGVGQTATVRGPQRRGGVGAAGLRPHLHAFSAGKCREGVGVVRTQRQQVTEDQHRGRLGDGNLDLRHAVGDRQPGDQLAQARQQRRHMLWQDVARAHVDDVARAPLVEAHPHAALARHQPHAEPCAVAIAPGRAVDRRIHDLRLHAADVPQRILQHALLGGGLRHRVQVLHRAAAAGAEIGTTWGHALRAGLQHARGVGLFVARLHTIGLVLHALARQRAVDEDRLAFHMGDAATFVVQRLDDCDGHGWLPARKISRRFYRLRAHARWTTSVMNAATSL